MSGPINRRFFHRRAAQAALGATLLPGALAVRVDAAENIAGDGVPLPAEGSRAAAPSELHDQLLHEAARDVPVVESVDVIVAGGGPAGIAAALSAARCGATVRLLEVHGCLGGVWTAGMLSWVLDAGNKPGLMAELTRHLEARHAGIGMPESRGRGVAYDVEVMKVLLEELCLEAGVRIQYHTRVVAAARNADNRLAAVVTESKSGRQAWVASSFVDCTGDGDLAALAGCGFDLGSEATGATQPLSLMAIVTGLNFDEVRSFTGGLPGQVGDDHKRALFEVMSSAGTPPSYAKPTLFHIRGDLFALMANHEYGVSAIDAGQITQATLRARGELNQIIRALRNAGGIWGKIQLVATGSQIGVREGRRIHGLYTVTADDVANGAVHEDAVCRVTFGVDVHALEADGHRGIERSPIKSRPYDIPLRALIAKDVDGLLMAGRCISGDFLAHSSYRVTGNSVALGQAAGTTAALAASSQSTPREVPFDLVKETMTRLDFLVGSR